MGEAEVASRSRPSCVGELGRYGEPPGAAPRAEVHLVDRHRLARARPARGARHPVVVAPVVRRLDRRPTPSAAAPRSLERHRVGLAARTRRRRRGSRTCSGVRSPTPGHEQLPDPGDAQRAASGASRPSQPLKSPDDADRARVRRPHRERGAGDRRRISQATCAPSTSPQLLVPALVERCRSSSPSVGRKRYGSSQLRSCAARVGHLEPVAERQRAAGDDALEDALGAAASPRAGTSRPPGMTTHGAPRPGGTPRTDDVAVVPVRAEHGVRVAVVRRRAVELSFERGGRASSRPRPGRRTIPRRRGCRTQSGRCASS